VLAFAGAGTVGVAAKMHGRRFFGIELNPEYVGMAARRIDKTKAREKLVKAQLPHVGGVL
jgi:DNA modification methylase